MTPKNRYHGGLEFLGDDGGALKRFSRVIAATLEDYGHLVERRSLLTDTEASIVTSQYLVHLGLDTDLPQLSDRQERMDQAGGVQTLLRKPLSRQKNRLVITLTPVSDILDDVEISELMLVVMLYRMIDICASQQVEWLSPETVLTIEQFMSAFSSLSPRRQKGHKQAFDSVSGPFAGLEAVMESSDPAEATAGAQTGRPIQLTEDELLALALRPEPDTLVVREVDSIRLVPDTAELKIDLQRLSSWGLTGAVATLSAPVAASLAAVNLVRGEDFRLNTQVLSYTAALVLIQSSGALADVTTVLGM